MLNITEPCVCLAAARLIFELRRYDVRPMLLSGLLTVLRPAQEEEEHKSPNLKGDIFTLAGKNRDTLAGYKLAQLGLSSGLSSCVESSLTPNSNCSFTRASAERGG